MRVARSLRSLSLGVATASFLLAGAACAQSIRLSGVNTELDRVLDSQNAKPGQAVEVKLDGSVRTADGMDLPKGTELMGQVSRAQASESGGPSSISLVFTRAQLKDGKTIPVKVTVVGAYPASDGYEATYGYEDVAPAPKILNLKGKYDQEAGILSNISMTSSVQGHNSATFMRKDGNIKLAAGTILQVEIGAANGNGAMTSGA